MASTVTAPGSVRRAVVSVPVSSGGLTANLALALRIGRSIRHDRR
jgi:hypothetical protein